MKKLILTSLAAAALTLTVGSKGRRTHCPAHPERYAGRTGCRIPAGCRCTRTESARYPYQPGIVREAGRAGGFTKQNLQAYGGKGVQGSP